MKTALITGITGQDGSFLAEFLLGKGYDVHGTIRRSSVDFRERIAHLEGHPNFHLHYADLGDSMSIIQVLNKVRPDEVYNLAAQSHVQVSFDSPEFTADVDALAKLIKGTSARVNLIRFHKIPGSELSPTSQAAMEAFRDRLNELGVTATIRASRGEDIAAACGMLAGKNNPDKKEQDTI